jgi:hypothetical protein
MCLGILNEIRKLIGGAYNRVYIWTYTHTRTPDDSCLCIVCEKD